MAVTITAPVGYKSANRPDDVRKVHDLLKRVPPTQGGPPPSFNPAVPYSPSITDQHIYSFQVKQFGKGPNADAVVDPNRETLKRLNALGGGVGINPPPGPPGAALPPTAPVGPAPGNRCNIGAVLTPNIVSHAIIAGYQGEPIKLKSGIFKVPTYQLLLGRYRDWEKGIDPAVMMEFEVVRFGVKFDASKVVLGEKSNDAYTIQGTCVGDFILSRAPYLDGSWRIKGEYYIHVGPGSPRFRPDDPKKLSGALGCVEVVSKRWNEFQVAARVMALGHDYADSKMTDTEADKIITDEKLFRMRVMSAPKPPLVRLD